MSYKNKTLDKEELKELLQEQNERNIVVSLVGFKIDSLNTCNTNKRKEVNKNGNIRK